MILKETGFTQNYHIYKRTCEAAEEIVAKFRLWLAQDFCKYGNSVLEVFHVVSRNRYDVCPLRSVIGRFALQNKCRGE